MKAAAWLLAAMLAVGALACGGSAAVEPEQPEEQRTLTPVEVVEAGKGIAEQYRQAYQVRAFDALAQLYVQNLDLIVVHQGEALHGWTAVAEHLKALLDRASDIHLTLTDVHVTALGPEAASIAASLKREIGDGTATVVVEGQLTLAVRLEGEAWVIAAEHFSYPPR